MQYKKTESGEYPEIKRKGNKILVPVNIKEVQKESEDGNLQTFYEYDLFIFRPDGRSDVEIAKEAKLQTIREKLQTELQKGYEFTFNSKTYALQTRDAEDKANWLGVMMKAQNQLANSDTTKINIRTKSDDVLSIAPSTLVSILNGALGHIEELMATSWQKKDAVISAETYADVEKVVW